MADMSVLDRSRPSLWEAGPATAAGAGEAAMAEMLKALAHPARLAILRAVAGRERCCCADICAEIPLAQSTVSQHLKVLRQAGLITWNRDRPHSRYRIEKGALERLAAELGAFAEALEGAARGATPPADDESCASEPACRQG